MKTVYKTINTCSSEIHLEIEGGVIGDVRFVNGCNGNLQAIAKLVKGMNVDDAVSKLQGIRCGSRSTSCADQLANAIVASSSNI